MESIPCPFCPPPADRVVASNDLAVAIRDGYPVSPGHTLVIPKRHVASLADVAKDEAAGLSSLLAEARAQLGAELKPHAAWLNCLRTADLAQYLGPEVLAGALKKRVVDALLQVMLIAHLHAKH